MNTARFETWTWVLLYAGLLAAGLGIAVLQAGAAWGWTLVIAGGLAAAAGVVMIWLRARAGDAPAKPPGSP